VIRDDNHPDDELERRLSALGRSDPVSATFTDRVLADLHQSGLVRPPRDVRTTARWWAVAAAAVALFAAGIGVGSAMSDTRRPPATTPTPSRATADRAGAEVNVPRVGQSEVWF